MSSCVWKQESTISYAMTSFLILGIQISYLPQHIAILRSRSSKGISWISIWLAAISTTCNLVASVVSVNVWPKFECCHNSWGAGYCISSILPEIQLATGFANTWILFTLVVLFHKSEMDYILLAPSTDSIVDINQFLENKKTKRKKKVLWIVYVFTFIVCFACFFSAGLSIIYKVPDHQRIIGKYAMAIGILAASAVFIQWTPQIYKTWVNKDPGALSILFLLLQTPGSFMCVYAFLGVRPWYVWASYGVSGIQQSITLCLVLLYTPKIRKFFGCSTREKDESRHSLLTEGGDEPNVDGYGDDYDDQYGKSRVPSLTPKTPQIS